MKKPTSSKDGHEYGYRPAKSPQSLLSSSSFNFKRRTGSRPLACGLPASPVRGSLGPVLTEKGYEVFLPTCKSRRQRSDRYVTLELPLFPGYLFCRCAEPHISSVLNTCGVLRVLGTRESPAVVNEEEIRHLATVTRAKLDLQPCAFITSGQKVRIHRGPLCGVEGIITGFDSRRQKVVVSISLLQRSAAVSLEPDWLTPQSERLMQS